jgi:tRNA(Arg) A34 adenosine deaminase TadA
MCLGALYWSRPKKVYYASTRADAANIGFDDSYIYEQISLPIEQRKISMECLQCDEANKLFEEWKSLNNKTLY